MVDQDAVNVAEVSLLTVVVYQASPTMFCRPPLTKLLPVTENDRLTFTKAVVGLTLLMDVVMT